MELYTALWPCYPKQIKMCQSLADACEVADLVKTYAVSPQEAQRLLVQFESDRDGIDLLLRSDSRVASERHFDHELGGDFLYSI